MEIEGKKYFHCDFAVKPLLSHRLMRQDYPLILILIHPATQMGFSLIDTGIDHRIPLPFQGWRDELIPPAQKLLKQQLNGTGFIHNFQKITAKYFSGFFNERSKLDQRIVRALNYMDKNPGEIIPLEEIAEIACLSTSRFIHLFKNTTGVSYRRLQLWNKIMNSYDFLPHCRNLTEVAHAAGFSDYAHYSRTFKESFGLKPTDLIKNSQFIQV